MRTVKTWIDLAGEYAGTAKAREENGEDPVDAFPMNETACSMYGGCAFRGVCARSPSVRHIYLREFDVDIWNPLEIR